MASKGLQGYSHYRNSTPSMQMEEPLYLNLFTVQLTPPAALAIDSDSVRLVLEGVKKFGGLNGVEQNPGANVKQTYKGAQRSYAGALGNKVLDLDLGFEVNLNQANQAYIYNFFRAWSDLIWNPLTGQMLLKRDYTAPAMILSMYNKVGAVYRRFVFRDIFISSPIDVPSLDYASGDNIFSLNMKFRCDYWDEVSAA